MKNLKQYIKEEIKKLSEVQYPAPPEILDVLQNKLKLNPLIRYVENLKAINSVPPSYRVFKIKPEEESEDSMEGDNMDGGMPSTPPPGI